MRIIPVIIAGGLIAAAVYETRRRKRRQRQREMLLEAGNSGEDARLGQGEEMSSLDQSSVSRPEQARSRDNARIMRPPYYWVQT
ncbi:hypothetical protein M378DRAFT_9698 [Amanita muscaria Koide BX008]|uniref:Uncharacterized protein n=1 Tax=Amanita muscaria (strain Koide BX008) TaxID=946122 RepID=A0A0C2XDX1_AMAMK|nr:hypothetical protein M378DRAFT_9698 [Amanita muscaria Koide BX008]